jgi:glycosyltransferase involved in cell wall biosynthesis
MKLAIFLPIGSSLGNLKASGQDKRFVDYYLKAYSKKFDQVYVFSYAKESYKLLGGCTLIINKWRLNRFLYAICFPFLYRNILKQVRVIRIMQLTGVIPALICKICLGKPFIFTYGYDYSAFAKLEGQIIRPILFKFLEKIAIKFSSGVIVTNKIIMSYLKNKYVKAKIVYLPNGVDIEKFKVPARSWSVSGGQLVKLLFVGRLVKQKNLENLIKAVSMLNKDYKIKLLFIGSGELKAQLINLAQQLSVDLKIIDRISHDKLPNYYKQANIFVLPSLIEGQPKVLLEAMSCGLPCLVGKYPGVEEFANNKEVFVCGASETEISLALTQLIKNDNLRANLGRHARKRVEKDFNIVELLNKEIEILKNV